MSDGDVARKVDRGVINVYSKIIQCPIALEVLLVACSSPTLRLLFLHRQDQLQDRPCAMRAGPI